MNRTGIFLIEEIGYLSMITYALRKYPDRIEGSSVTAIVLIPAIAIAAVTLIQYLLEKKVKERFSEILRNKGNLIYSFTVYGIVFLVSYVFFAALEHFGNMPASFRTLVFISMPFALLHIMIGNFPRLLSMAKGEADSDEEESGM